MASIENRSNYEVTVRNRDDLTQTFAHSALKRAKAYQQSLASQGFKSKLSRRDDYYVVRDRSRLRKEQVLRAGSLAEAKAIQSLLENEQRQGLIVDYAQGFQTSLAELMIRYLRAEASTRETHGCGVRFGQRAPTEGVVASTATRRCRSLTSWTRRRHRLCRANTRVMDIIGE